MHFLTLGIAISGSFALGLGWKVLGFWYSQRIESYGSWITNLKRQHRDKVEEFKVKSGYYQTKSLIERFDKSLGDDGGEEEERASIPNESSPASTNLNLPQAMNELPLASGQELAQSLPTTSGHELPSFLANPPSPIENYQLPSPAQSFFFASSPPIRMLPRSRGWMDKIVDAVLGEVPEHYKYALICSSCASHNGLCFPEELSVGKKFICASCGHMNDYKREVREERISESQTLQTNENEEKSLQTNESEEKSLQANESEKEEDTHSAPLPEEQHSTLRKRKSRSRTNKRKDNSQSK